MRAKIKRLGILPCLRIEHRIIEGVDCKLPTWRFSASVRLFAPFLLVRTISNFQLRDQQSTRATIIDAVCDTYLHSPYSIIIGRGLVQAVERRTPVRSRTKPTPSVIVISPLKARQAQILSAYHFRSQIDFGQTVHSSHSINRTRPSHESAGAFSFLLSVISSVSARISHQLSQLSLRIHRQ